MLIIIYFIIVVLLDSPVKTYLVITFSYYRKKYNLSIMTYHIVTYKNEAK